LQLSAKGRGDADQREVSVLKPNRVARWNQRPRYGACGIRKCRMRFWRTPRFSKILRTWMQVRILWEPRVLQSIN